MSCRDICLLFLFPVSLWVHLGVLTYFIISSAVDVGVHSNGKYLFCYGTQSHRLGGRSEVLSIGISFYCLRYKLCSKINFALNVSVCIDESKLNLPLWISCSEVALRPHLSDLIRSRLRVPASFVFIHQVVPRFPYGIYDKFSLSCKYSPFLPNLAIFLPNMVSSSTIDHEHLVKSSDPQHPANLICTLCEKFYHLGWVTGTGGGASIRDK